VVVALAGLVGDRQFTTLVAVRAFRTLVAIGVAFVATSVGLLRAAQMLKTLLVLALGVRWINFHTGLPRN